MSGGDAPGVLLAASYGMRVGYAWNNIYRLYNTLARALAARGLRVCVSFRDFDGEITVFDRDLRYETFQYNPRLATPAALSAVRTHFRQHRIRYVYLTDQPPVRWDYAVMRTWGVRRIVVHNRISVPDPRPARPDRSVRGLVRVAANRLPLVTVDRVFAVSNFVRNRLIASGVPPARVRTILNGIEVDRWRCPEPPAGAGTPVRFFAAARAARYKGIGVLIEAAARLRQEHGIEGFHVSYAGAGPDLAAFEARVAALDLDRHFTFLGELKDTRGSVCAADVVVVPSAYGDACPSTVSEALASGRALITTHAGGIPELVGDPANAILVPPDDVAALASAMAQIVRDPAARLALGQRGRARAEAALQQGAYHQTVVDALLAEFGLTDGPGTGGA